MTAKPNFFIVGARRPARRPCTSTSGRSQRLHAPAQGTAFLRDGPGRISPHQDPGRLRRAVRRAHRNHAHLGEASVHYPARRGPSNIRAFDPHARIVAMLRKPVDLVHALHGSCSTWRRRRSATSEPRGGCRRGAERGSICCQLPHAAPAGLRRRRQPRHAGHALAGDLSTRPGEATLLFEDFTAYSGRGLRRGRRFLRCLATSGPSFRASTTAGAPRSATLKRFLRKPPPCALLVRGLEGSLGAEGLVALKTGVVRLGAVKAGSCSAGSGVPAELVDAFGRDRVAGPGPGAGPRSLDPATRCAPPTFSLGGDTTLSLSAPAAVPSM